MKKNNKGFMLVEVIIVTVVVATIMTSLYVVFNRVYNAYDKKSTYNDINAIYALRMISDYMIDVETFNQLIINFSDSSPFELTCDMIVSGDDTYCNSVFDKYNINKMYFVKNDKTFLEKIKEESINQTFKDYIDYLINIGIYTDTFSEKGKYAELLIVETHSLDSDRNILNKYAYLPTRIIR